MQESITDVAPREVCFGCGCDECEKVMASMIDLINESKKSSKAKNRIKKIKHILKSALIPGIILLSQFHS
jgi:hypothetical protein